VARVGEDREDLLRDARNLSPRVQLRARVGGRDTAVFAGFRGESLSLYFGPEPVFHFNAAGELRRAFLAGRIVKAENGQLFGMERVNGERQVELRTSAVSDNEQQAAFADLAARLADLCAAFSGGKVVIEGQEPADGGAIERLKHWLERHAALSIAASPRVD
jgi:hypothetical protein